MPEPRLESWNEALGVLESHRHIPVVVGTAAMTSRVTGTWCDRLRREDGGVLPRLQPQVASAHVVYESSSHLLRHLLLTSYVPLRSASCYKPKWCAEV